MINMLRLRVFALIEKLFAVNGKIFSLIAKLIALIAEIFAVIFAASWHPINSLTCACLQITKRKCPSLQLLQLVIVLNCLLRHPFVVHSQMYIRRTLHSTISRMCQPLSNGVTLYRK